MNAPDFDRLEALFAAALHKPTDQRRAFATQASGDPAETGELLALLTAHELRGQLDSITDRLRRPRGPATLSLDDVLARLGDDLARRYCIERELGRGGTAIVLLAEDLKHERKVALKILHPDLALSIGAARFLREIAIAAKLTHPHILPLHDSGEAGGLLYYVMPYVEGESLRDRLRREERLSVDQSLQIARQVADALSYAHGRGVVHRDIKPENILLEAGHAVVSDFGIARAMSAAGGDELSETGIILGTPAYMSPEQAVGADDIDGRTDIYSLGCVLFEMLAGTPPFTESSVEKLLRDHLTATVPVLREIRPDVPHSVQVAVERSLSKSPAARFPDASSFADTLPLPGALSAAAHAKRSRRVLWIVGAGALLGAATTMMLGGHRRPDPMSVIAVLPLVPTARDTSLARLGRDFVVTLSAALEGVRRTRAVDALTVLAQTRESGTLGLQPGLQLAGLLAATSAVHGAIVREGSEVRIDAGLFRTDDGQAIARASVTGDPREIASITDSIAAILLRSAWRTPTAEVPGVSSVTTRSLPALQAFLEGEHALLEGRWQGAAQSYQRAMKADSTFWLAYWRFEYARAWYLNLDDSDIIDAIKAHRAALPERDRLVFESWLTDTIALALSRAREATERFPDYWPGWMQYGDWLFHSGPVYGHPEEEAQAALERTVALNPAFIPAWEHLLWVALVRDTTAAARALAALEQLAYPQAVTTELGFDITRVYRLEVQFARAGALDRLLLDSVASDLVHRARVRVGGGADAPRVQVELSRRVLRSRPRPDLAAVHERLLSDAWASRGAWDSAVAVASPRAPLDGYRLAVIGSWVGALSPAAAHQRRGAAARAAVSVGLQAELAWLDGVLAAAEQDRSGIALARARLAQTDTLPTPVLERSLAALDLELAGSREEAARMLATLNWDRPDVLAPAAATHPYVIAISRLAAAKWLIATGDTTAASTALMWFDALWALDGYRQSRRVLASLALFERGRLEEGRRNNSGARQAYASFLTRYDAPVGLQRHLVEEARVASARLEAFASKTP